MTPRGASHRQIAGDIFKRVEQDFRHLVGTTSWDPNKYVDLELVFERQPGLVFKVVVHLQGDELCLGVGDHFWCEWFPCGDHKVVAKFVEAFGGVLSGDVRLVEYSKHGRVIKAQLQKQHSEVWSTISTWTKLRWPSFGRRVTTIRRNA